MGRNGDEGVMTNGTERHGADEQAIAAFMTRVAALPVTLTLPDPMYLWWKAQLLQRREAGRRARFPVDVIQPIEIAAGLLAAGRLFPSSLWHPPAPYPGQPPSGPPIPLPIPYLHIHPLHACPFEPHAPHHRRNIA